MAASQTPQHHRSGLSAFCWLACLCVGLCAARAHAEDAGHVQVKLLGLNDFHGQLEAGRSFLGRPVGSAPVLAAYLRAAQAQREHATLIIHAGDWVGASPPSSALLQDEPSMQFLSLLTNRFCTRRALRDPRCNLAATPGNHEFDEGVGELLRLLRGGNAARGPFLERPYRGIAFPYVCANVLDRRSGAPLLAPYVVKQLAGVRLGIVGAVTAETPTLVPADGVRSVQFIDAAEAINRQAQKLERQGIRAVVVTVHQGGAQDPYEGSTRPDAEGPREGIVDLIDRLDDAVDVVISGHAHAFTNALMKNRNGHAILVTQAGSAGGAYADIDLVLDARSGEVIEKSARIVPTWADQGVGLTPAADVAELVARAAAYVAPLTARRVGRVDAPVQREPNAAGESALGNLIADAQRHSANAQIALMNQGGIRTSLEAGEITWGELFAIQPFSNTLISMDLTGAQILRALEQQWEDTPPHRLQVSGLSYSWDPARPIGARVVSAAVGDSSLAEADVYRVVVNSFLAGGGNGFTAFLAGKARRVGELDLDALVSYIGRQPGPITPAIQGRVRAH